MASKIEIRFVPGRLESTTRRDYEIQLSNIRSHAGRVTHARKREQVVPGSKKVNARFVNKSKRLESESQTSASVVSKNALSAVDEIEYGRWTNLLSQEWTTGTSWQWSKGARVDPFNCLPLNGDTVAQNALDFMGVTKWCWPSHNCMNDALNLRSQFDGRWLLEQMATNQMLFHVVVAQMEACRALLVQREMAFPSESHLYMRKAILSLQQELSDPTNGVTDAMIATSAYLFLYEASVGDWNAAMFHRAQIGNLIARKGGMESLPKGSAIRTMMILHNSVGPGFIHDLPQPQTTYPIIPLSGKALEMIELLPPGFKAIARHGSLSLETIDIVLRLARKNFWATRRPHCLDRILSDKSVDQVFFDLDDACPALLFPDHPKQLAFEKLLCLAIMKASIGPSERFIGAGSVFGAVAMRTSQLLLEAIPCWEGPERDCLLWISLSLIDSFASEITLTLSWARQIPLLFPETSTWTMDQYEQFGQNYIWMNEWSELLRRSFDALNAE